MNNLLQDVRYAVGMLLKSPSFMAIAVITLALGIGANTAIFSVVNAILLTPLPVENPSEIVGIYTSDFSGPVYSTSSYPDVQAFQAGTSAFQGLAAHTLQPMTLDGGENSERVFAEIVSGEYFQVLGIRPQRGRIFLPEESVTPGTHPVVVLSHAYWQRRFGGDTSLVGQSITVNGQALTVVGIAPQSFPGMLRGLKPDLWVPMMMLDRLVPREAGAASNRGNRLYFVAGRLKPGFNPEAAQAQLNVVAQQLHKEFPDNWTDVQEHPRRVTVVPEFEARIFPGARGPVIGFSAVLMVVVGLVLMVACSNVANLLLARATARRREIAIRLSLGATRGRLIRQLVTESTLLALLGGAAGILLAMWGADALARLKPPLPIPVDLTFGIDARGISIEGYQRKRGEDLEFHHGTVGPGYFHTLGIPLLRGRDFTAQDRAGATPVAVINETFAQRFWPQQDALGKRISHGGNDGAWIEIVGVARDGKYGSLGESALPWFATSLLQDYNPEATLILRARSDVKGVLAAARQEIRRLDKSLPVTASTVQDHLSLSVFPARAAAGIVGFFGALALLLAIVGLYGVMSYAAAQRTREVGIRMALGARRADVVALLVRQGMKLALIGAAIGIALAAGITRALTFLLYGISPTDPLTFAGVTLLLVAVAFAASYLSARRAARVDPMIALHYE